MRVLNEMFRILCILYTTKVDLQCGVNAVEDTHQNVANRRGAALVPEVFGSIFDRGKFRNQFVPGEERSD